MLARAIGDADTPVRRAYRLRRYGCAKPLLLRDTRLFAFACSKTFLLAISRLDSYDERGKREIRFEICLNATLRYASEVTDESGK